MATNTYMGSMYLELQNRVGEDNNSTEGIVDKISLSVITEHFTLLKKNIGDCSVSITDINFNMKVYEPDHITVNLKIVGKKLDMAKVADELMGLRATLKYVTSDGKDKSLSDNLFVFQALPSINKSNTDGSISMRLELYSADKLIELQKFSQSFTGLPLGKILTDAALDAYVPKNNGADMYKLGLDVNPQILRCTIKDDPKRELIQPYLAQYNETFRSMLNRTTNRCGEFLYWHDGKLQYGLHSDASCIDLTADADLVALSAQPTSRFETLNVTETHRNGGKDADFSENGEINYDLETGTPDFNNTVKFVYGSDREYSAKRNYGTTFGFKYYTNPDDKNYDSINWKKSDNMKFVIGNFLSGYAKTSNIWNFISDFIVDVIADKPYKNLIANKEKDDAAQKINHKRLISDKACHKYGFVPDEQTNFSEKLNEKNQYTDTADGVKGYDSLECTNKIAPFSTLKAAIEHPIELLDNAVMGNAFYSKVRTLGYKVAHNAIDITLLSNVVPLQIGQRITVNSKKYIVTDIKGTCKSQNGIAITSTIHAIPEVTVGEAKMFLPEPLPEQNRKMDGNCTAIITDTDDPYGQGRVRVRFSWQGRHPVGLSADSKKQCFEKAISDVYSSEKTPEAKQAAYEADKYSCMRTPDDKEASKRCQDVETKTREYEQDKLKEQEQNENVSDSTPWIRMASPMAGKASLYMQPSEDDEVIVGFENGNIERPYVLGSLFNGTNGAPGGHGITMANGHGISLENEDMSAADIVNSLISPAAKNILSRIDSEQEGIDDPKFHVGGKVSIKDKYGFYSLSMSSADREVNIKCPLGQVSISAFTGISISAPNGDINIKGKNVNITAGDKITLTSGTNKDILDTGWGDMGGIIQNAMSKAALSALDNTFGDTKVIDLGVARQMWEVLFRPVNGTLSIKSKRHLIMEAGKGNVEMPIDTLKTNKTEEAVEMIPNYPYFLMKDFLSGLKGEVQNRLSALQVAYDNVMGCQVRKKIEEADLNARPTMSTNYLNAYGTYTVDLTTKLWEKKMDQIIEEVVTLEAGSNKCKIDSGDKFMKYCPFPDHENFNDPIDDWKKLVMQTAQKVANFKNLFAALTNSKITDAPAFKEFIKTLGELKLENLDNLKDITSKVQYKKVGDLSAAATDLKLDDFKKFSAFKPIVIMGAYDTSTLCKLQLFIINALHEAGKVAIIAHNDPIEKGKDKYHLCKEVPTYDEITDPNGDWKGWNIFMDHCVPANSITDIDSHYNWAAVGNAIKDFFVDTFKDKIDKDNLNTNWITGKETRVWDTKSHPGLILMSSENGSTTAVVGKDGKLTSSENYSLSALLKNMKAESGESHVPVNVNSAIANEQAWSKDLKTNS